MRTPPPAASPASRSKRADLAVGGSAQLFPMGKADNQDNLLQVVRVAAGDGAAGLVAYSAICTHLGCAVFEKLNRDGLILCPCHGSIYDPANHAAVRRGPSDRALPGIPIADGPNGTVRRQRPVRRTDRSAVGTPACLKPNRLQLTHAGRDRPGGAADGLQPTADKVGWLEERLQLSALQDKYGRKAFPVHSTFFLGEMAAISFLILVLTGVYLGLIYTPSNADITVAGQKLPEAFASVQLIESIPVANLIRNVHHWAAHVMIADAPPARVAGVLHRHLPQAARDHLGLGVVLLGLTLAAGFVGYALPWDAFAVTATGIGYGLARSIPVVGHLLGDLFFGGAFPSLGSLPRLYTIHVVVIPAEHRWAC